MKKSRLWYMHTLDGKPASYGECGGAFLWFASKGHRTRAAQLVPTLRQIDREQQRCIAEDCRRWASTPAEHRGERPSAKRYGYVLVSFPALRQGER